MKTKFASIGVLALVLTACGDMSSCCDDGSLGNAEQATMPGEFSKKLHRVGPPSVSNRLGRHPRATGPSFRCWFSDHGVAGAVPYSGLPGPSPRVVGKIACSGQGGTIFLHQLCIRAHARDLDTNQEVEPKIEEIPYALWGTNGYSGAIGAASRLNNGCLNFGFIGLLAHSDGYVREAPFRVDFNTSSRGRIAYQFEIDASLITVEALGGGQVTVDGDHQMTEPVTLPSP